MTTRGLQACLIILSGIILIFVSLYAGDATPEAVTLGTTFIALLQALGVAVFAFGFFNVIVETKEWQGYFEERIRHIVIEQSYLRTLDRDILSSLQTNVLKALFKDPTIDREGSFLNYFHANLHKYIAEPYREDVTSEILCEADGDSAFRVFDRVTYVCRRSTSSIQRTVSWQPDPDEFVEVLSLSVEVQYPYNHEKKGERVSLYPETDLQGKKCDEISLAASLDPYKDVDGLIVVVTSRYRMNRERFQYWQMAHPTKNFDITITYPRDYDIQIKPLVISPELALITQSPGYMKVKYDSWMLPQSGLAWRFIPISGSHGPVVHANVAEAK